MLPDFSDAVASRLADEERLRAARVALGRLRRREREVFGLVVWAGLDYATAGEALGVPVGTVRSRLSRARERLRSLAEAELRAGRRGRRRGGAGDGPGPGSVAGPGGGAGAASRTASSPGAGPGPLPPSPRPGAPDAAEGARTRAWPGAGAPSLPVSAGRTVLVPRTSPEKPA